MKNVQNISYDLITKDSEGLLHVFIQNKKLFCLKGIKWSKVMVAY